MDFLFYYFFLSQCDSPTICWLSTEATQSLPTLLIIHFIDWMFSLRRHHLSSLAKQTKQRKSVSLATTALFQPSRTGCRSFLKSCRVFILFDLLCVSEPCKCCDAATPGVHLLCALSLLHFVHQQGRDLSLFSSYAARWADGFTPGLTCRPHSHVESTRAEFRSEMEINAGIRCLLTWRQEAVFNSLLIAWVWVCLVNLTALYLDSYLPSVCNRPFIQTAPLESRNVWEAE